MSDILLNLENISFAYGREQVFKDFSFSVIRGSRIAIKGGSGAGKTTLFRLMLGFEQPDQGSIAYRLNGEEINPVEIRKHSVWLPQDLNLGSGTVREVIRFPFDFQQNSARQPKGDEIVSLLEALGLHRDLLEKSFSSLSTGQRQRIGFTICLLLNRPVFFLDEPTSALDEASKQKAIDLFFEDPGRTIISTSHDPWWLQRCDEVIEL